MTATVVLSIDVPITNDHAKFRGGRTGTLSGLMEKDISKRLGFEAQDISGTNDKVTRLWSFKVMENQFQIWNYKGSDEHSVWSCRGNSLCLAAIFGENYQPN